VDLANSIKEHGIIQPLIVTPVDDGYQLIAGERRLRAAKMIGLKAVPAIVRRIERHQQLELALIENIQRKDLNPIEQAVAFRRLIDEFNFTHEEMARRLGKSRPYISNALRLLNLPEDIQEAVATEKINFTAARTLAGMPTEEQRRAFQQIKEGKLDVTGLNVESRKISVKRHVRKIGKDPNILAKQKELEEALGTRVVIKKSGESGQVIIDFYSEEDLANLFQRLIGSG
jgi:ParB family chromosome partitioning protein